jgi:hypothetical protein
MTTTNRFSAPLRKAAALAGLSAAAMLEAVPALAAPSSIVLRQLTNITTGTIESPKLQLEDGHDLAFVSNGDVMGPGTQTANKQVYLLHENDVTGAWTTKKLTNGVGCDSWDVTRPTDTVSSDRPMVVAFVSNCDHDPAVGNADGNNEIFFYDLFANHIHQITDTVAPVDNGDPFLSDSGRCMVFRSNGDLENNVESNPYFDVDHPGAGYTNPDGSMEVFLYGTLEQSFEYPHNATYSQVSNGPAGTTSEKPVIGGYIFSRQCQTTAFQSDHDQLGTGLVGQHVYQYNWPSSELVQEFPEADEIPHGLPPGTYGNASISQASPFARGPHIVFESEADLWNNGSLGTDIFDFRAFHPRMTQYTNVGAGFVTRSPQVSDGGGVITFHSNGEILTDRREARDGSMPPFNADGNFEIFRLNGRRTVTQITRTENCNNTSSSILDDGNRVSFLSDCDVIAGENALGRTQVFLYALERGDAPVLLPGVCTQANGCCYYARNAQTCYSDLTSRKNKISRPNCAERDACLDN